MLAILLAFFTATLAAPYFLQHHIVTSHRLRRIEALAETERRLIESLAGNLGGELDDEVRYFLNFLLEDTGYPYMLPVADTLKYPLDRFKVVERYLYDWPILSELLDEVGSRLDITATFQQSTPSPPDYKDLVETVREMNEIIGVYGLAGELDALASVKNIPLNSGNLLILANISHALHHTQQCVMWGRRADRDLVSSDEPFTIPGEDYWLELYLGYLECLVRAGDQYQTEKGEVKNEILAHYGTVKKVKKTVKTILKSGPIKEDGYSEDCKVTVGVTTACRVEQSRDPFSPLSTEQVLGSDIVYYHGIDAERIAAIQHCSQTPEDRVLLFNPAGDSPIHVATEESGTLALHSGDGMVIAVRDVRRVCTPLLGYAEIYSCSD